MAVLTTVADYVAAARVLLQDTEVTYRYPDADILAALNYAMLEARRLRPDLFLTNANSMPTYSAIDTTAVAIDQQYRLALLHFVVGHISLRDDEDVQEQRAASFIAAFKTQLVGG